MDTVNPVLVIVAVVLLMEQHAVVQPVPEQHSIRLMEQHAVVQPVPKHNIRQVVLAVLAHHVVPTVQHAVVQAVKSKCLSFFLFLKFGI
jgi:hypothetical protein